MEAAKFQEFVRKGDYAEAIRLVEKSGLPRAEKDGTVGILILDGLVVPTAAKRPAFPLAEGFERLEQAAGAGRKQSISDLRAKFTTGINYEGKNVLMVPNAGLAECWSRVEAGAGAASKCAAMRRGLKIP